MAIKADLIVEAGDETLYPLTIPVQVRNGDGTPHEEKLELKYREPTEERIAGSNASVLAALVAEWNVVGDDEQAVAPDYAYFSRRPLAYTQKLVTAIMADYNPQKKS